MLFTQYMSIFIILHQRSYIVRNILEGIFKITSHPMNLTGCKHINPIKPRGGNGVDSTPQIVFYFYFIFVSTIEQFVTVGE